MKKIVFLLIFVFSWNISIFASNNKIGITTSVGAKAYGETGDFSSLLDYLWFGMSFKVSEDAFIRPAILFSYSEPKDDVKVGTSIPSEEKKLALGVKCAFLFSIVTLKSFDFYIGPEVGYIIYNTEENDIGSNKDESKRNIMDLYLKIGGQYLISDNFGFFGDIGIGVQFYTRNNKTWNSAGTLTSEVESSYKDFRTSNAYLGAVFYF